MVRLIKVILLLFVVIPSSSQVSFFLNEETRTIEKVSDYNEEGSELWTGIIPLGLMVYRIIQSDTIPIYISIGCTQYQMDYNNLNLYIWMDNYYGSDCLCADSEDPCRPDTSICNIKIKFTYTKDKLICSLSDLRPDYYIDTMVEFKQALNAISSSKFCKLTSINKIFKKKCFNYTIDIIRKYYSFYYDIAIHYLKTNNKKALSKLSYNIKRYYVLYDIERSVPAPINYENNIIKYLGPMRNKEFINEDISIFSNNIKKIILL